MNMDFLKPLFNEELNSEGDIVEIAGSTFERSNILNGLEPETYNIAFDEWLRDRQARVFEQADNILKLNDNLNIYEQLLTIFKNGNLVPFIGAGMSRASGYLTWTEFLFSCCSKSSIEVSKISDLLKEGAYEEAAQLLYDDMTPPLFNKHLTTTYGSIKKINGSIHYLPYLFNDKHVITTNFDSLLERLYVDKDCPFESNEVKSGASLPEILSIIPHKPKILIKLHGTWDEINNRVLLKSEYDKAYKDSGSVTAFFERVIFRDSILFLGASLVNDRTLLKMKEIASVKGHHTLPDHYAFLEYQDEEDVIKRSKELAQANIFPIWYPEGEHDESIEALLCKLTKDSE